MHCLYLLFLTVHEILTTRAVCKKWNEHSHDGFVWLHFLKKLTPDVTLFTKVHPTNRSTIYKKWSQKGVGARMIFNPNDLMQDVKRIVPRTVPRMIPRMIPKTFSSRTFSQNHPVDDTLPFSFERYSTNAPLFAIYPEGIPVMGICLRLKVEEHTTKDQLLPFFTPSLQKAESFSSIIQNNVLEMKWSWTSLPIEMQGKTNPIDIILTCANKRICTINESKQQEICQTFSKAWTQLESNLSSNHYYSSSRIHHTWKSLGNVYGLKADQKVSPRHRAIWEFMGIVLHLDKLDDMPSVKLMSITRVCYDSWIIIQLDPFLSLPSYLQYLFQQ